LNSGPESPGLPSADVVPRGAAVVAAAAGLFVARSFPTRYRVAAL
jgi:hypothetical protein